jgi:carbonic anhydrase
MLKVNLIVVLSHQNCGAIDYAYQHEETDCNSKVNLNHLLEQIRTVKNENGKISKEDLTIENAKQSAINIYTNSEIIKKEIDNKTAKIITGFYHITSGEVEFEKIQF